MAIVHEQKAQNTISGASGSIAATFTNPVGSGNAVVGIVSFGAPTNEITSITDDKGNTYTVSDYFADSGNGQSAASFHRGNITNAPNTVTVTYTGSQGANTLAIDEYSGIIALTDPRDGHTGQLQATPGTGTDAVISTAITPTTNGCLIWGSYAGTGGQTVGAAGTGFTPENSVTNSGGAVAPLVTEDLVQVTAASKAATFTNGGTGATIAFIIALKAVVVAGATNLVPQIWL